jgi:predicted glutamine amidotransferase
MCGLVGLAGNFYAKHSKMMKILLWLDTWRGRHSTGIATVSREREIDLFKRAIPGYEFVDHPVVDRIMGHTDRVWLGHNRHATIGVINAYNAHPFIVEDDRGVFDFVGAHNGTLSNRYNAFKKDGPLKPEAGDYGTDSEALMNAIYHHGPADTMKEIEGAWALTWYDRRNDSINFLRNKERTLYFTYVFNTEPDKKKKHQTSDTIAWASEMWMLRTAAEKADLWIGEIFYFTEDTLYTFHIPKEVSGTMVYSSKGGMTGKSPARPIMQSSGDTTRTTTRTYTFPPTTMHVEFRRSDLQIWNHTMWRWTTVTEERLEEERKKSNFNHMHFPDKHEIMTLYELNKLCENKSEKDKSEAGEQHGSETTEEKSNVLLLPKHSTTNSQTSSRTRYKGFNSKLLEGQELTELLKMGCTWCGDVVPPLKGSPCPSEVIAWIDDDKYVCKSCVFDQHETGTDAYTEIENAQEGSEEHLRMQAQIENAIEQRAQQEEVRGITQ